MFKVFAMEHGVYAISSEGSYTTSHSGFLNCDIKGEKKKGVWEGGGAM
jgi:hypothetical protein